MNKTEQTNEGLHEGLQLPIEEIPKAEIIRDERGSFVKGVSGNMKGKAKGTISKRSAILQKFTDDLLAGNGEKFKAELSKLKGKQFVDAYLTLMEYCLPKKARVEHVMEGDEMRIVQVFKIGEVEVKL